MKLAIVSTHPIQYNAPLFKLLASQPGLKIKVFYTLGKDYLGIKDKGFGKVITWDISLLNGYEYEFLENKSKNLGTSNFKGIVNPTIVKTVEAFKPSALLIFGWNFESHLKVLRYFKNKVPIYFRGDSTLLDDKIGPKVLFRRLILKWVYKHIDKAFYVGTNNKQYFLQHGVKEQDLIFAPHAVDNKRFGDDNAYAGESEIIRYRLGIPAYHTVFLFSGKFENKKSPLLLIKAFKKLQLQNVSLLLVGSGILEDRMKTEATGNRNIYFLPFQNQMIMPAVYRAANVLVLPSGGPGETWGLAINEAMVCGLAIIASTKVGCAVDLVQDSRNGYIFESGDAESLREKLSLFASNTRVEIHAMGQVSKEKIKGWNLNNLCTVIVSNINKVTL